MPANIDTIADMIRQLEADAEARGYARGKADAKKEMLTLLGGGSDMSNSSETHTPDQPSAPRSNVERTRAPKGSVRRLVRHALTVSPGGVTATEILGHARSDLERMIKDPSIRSELNVGRRQGEYQLQDGKWFLSEKVAEGQTTTAEPSASSQETEGGESDSAALV